MNPIKVSRTNLLNTLVKNREEHIRNFNTALAGYQEERNKLVTDMYNMVLLSRDFDPYTILRDLEKPKSHEKDYDRYIAMYSNSIDETIELSESEFNVLFLDQWSWHNTFNTSVAKYANK